MENKKEGREKEKVIVYAPHKIAKEKNEKLNKVINIMQKKGSPVIKVVDCGDYYQAIEGCHRLAACQILHINPKLEIYNYDDNKKIQVQIGNETKKLTIAQACDWANKGDRDWYEFEI